jgi:hypothetical protein
LLGLLQGMVVMPPVLPIALNVGQLLRPSENFVSLKYCDNKHNVVTIDTIFILYNK